MEERGKEGHLGDGGMFSCRPFIGTSHRVGAQEVVENWRTNVRGGGESSESGFITPVNVQAGGVTKRKTGLPRGQRVTLAREKSCRKGRKVA